MYFAKVSNSIVKEVAENNSIFYIKKNGRDVLRILYGFKIEQSVSNFERFEISSNIYMIYNISRFMLYFLREPSR